MGYLEGCTTKYVARWRKKGHIEDLRKALHYLDKLIEVADYNNLPLDCFVEEIDKFTDANALSAAEKDYIAILASYTNKFDLARAKHILSGIIEQAMNEVFKREEINRPGTPEDGGHHATK